MVYLLPVPRAPLMFLVPRFRHWLLADPNSDTESMIFHYPVKTTRFLVSYLEPCGLIDHLVTNSVVDQDAPMFLTPAF